VANPRDQARYQQAAQPASSLQQLPHLGVAGAAHAALLPPRSPDSPPRAPPPGVAVAAAAAAGPGHHQPWQLAHSLADLSLGPAAGDSSALGRGRGRAPAPANSTSNRLKSVLQTVLPCNVIGLFPEAHQQLLRGTIDPHLLSALANLAGFYCMNACAACESRFDGGFVERARAKVAHYASPQHLANARDFLRHSQSKLNRQMGSLELMMRAKAVDVLHQVEAMLAASQAMASEPAPQPGQPGERAAEQRELFLRHTQLYHGLALELMVLLDQADAQQQVVQQQQVAQQQQVVQQQQQQQQQAAAAAAAAQVHIGAPYAAQPLGVPGQVPVVAAAVQQASVAVEQLGPGGQEQYMYQQVVYHQPGPLLYQQLQPAPLEAEPPGGVYYSYGQAHHPGVLQPMVGLQQGVVMLAAAPGQGQPGAAQQSHRQRSQHVGRLMTPGGGAGGGGPVPVPPGLLPGGPLRAQAQVQQQGAQLELAPAGGQLYAYALPPDEGQYITGPDGGVYPHSQLYRQPPPRR
jgi:hypothetical protein